MYRTHDITLHFRRAADGTTAVVLQAGLTLACMIEWVPNLLTFIDGGDFDVLNH